MRNPDRIQIFKSEVGIEQLVERWGVDTAGYCPVKFFEYWENNPDQRIGQALINCQMIVDSMEVWNDEDLTILNDLEIDTVNLLLWTSYYDKDKNLLSEAVQRPITELGTGHIKAILDDWKNGEQCLRAEYIRAFNKILKERNTENIQFIKDKTIELLTDYEYMLEGRNPINGVNKLKLEVLKLTV